MGSMTCPSYWRRLVPNVPDTCCRDVIDSRPLHLEMATEKSRKNSTYFHVQLTNTGHLYRVSAESLHFQGY